MDQLAKFLTLQEVCKLLRIGERTAYELCRTGKMGGAVKVGGVWRIDRAAFERWIRKGGGPAGKRAVGTEGGFDGSP